MTQEPKDEAGEHHGEFRHVNKGPVAIRRLMETEVDPTEREALRIALEYWEMRKAGFAEAGEPYRGEDRKPIEAESIGELARAVKPVEHIFVMGELRIGKTAFEEE